MTDALESIDTAGLVAELHEVHGQVSRVVAAYPVIVRRAMRGILAASVEHSCGFGAEHEPERYWLIKRGEEILEKRPTWGYKLGKRPPHPPHRTHGEQEGWFAWEFEQIALWRLHSTDADWAERFGVQVRVAQ